MIRGNVYHDKDEKFFWFINAVAEVGEGGVGIYIDESLGNGDYIYVHGKLAVNSVTFERFQSVDESEGGLHDLN